MMFFTIIINTDTHWWRRSIEVHILDFIINWDNGKVWEVFITIWSINNYIHFKLHEITFFLYLFNAYVWGKIVKV